MSDPRRGAPNLAENADVRVAEFDVEYQLNYDRVMVRQSYPLDREKVQDWLIRVAQGGDDTLLEYAVALANTLRHISFAEFLQRLEACAIEVLKLCETTVRDLVILTNGGRGSSSYWTLMLVWPLVRPYVTRIISVMPESSAANVYGAPVQWRSAFAGPAVFVYIDDAILRPMGARDIAQRLLRGTTSTSATQFRFLVPFLTLYSKRALAQVGQQVFLENSEQVPTLRELLDQNFTVAQQQAFVQTRARNPAANRWVLDFYQGELEGSCTTVYFDHKLPRWDDSLELLLALGPAYSQDLGYTFGALIANCELPPAYPASRDDPVTTMERSLLLDFPGQIRCPPTFYHAIEWQDPPEHDYEAEEAIRDRFREYRRTRFVPAPPPAPPLLPRSFEIEESIRQQYRELFRFHPRRLEWALRSIQNALE